MPETTREHEPEQYGGLAPQDQSDANDTRFVACPGKTEARTEVGRPPAPLGRTSGEDGTQPPPPTPTPRRRNAPDCLTRGPPPRGAHNPKPGRRGTGRPPPPPPSKPNGARDRGRTRGGARGNGWSEVIIRTEPNPPHKDFLETWPRTLRGCSEAGPSTTGQA